MKVKAIILTFSAIIFGITTLSYSDQRSQLVGSWCFYEQFGYGNYVPEKVDITFYENGSYEWEEGPSLLKGAWSISQDELMMSDIGPHKILSLNDNDMKLERISVMKFRKGKCVEKNFSDQDVAVFF